MWNELTKHIHIQMHFSNANWWNTAKNSHLHVILHTMAFTFQCRLYETMHTFLCIGHSPQEKQLWRISKTLIKDQTKLPLSVCRVGSPWHGTSTVDLPHMALCIKFPNRLGTLKKTDVSFDTLNTPNILISIQVVYSGSQESLTILSHAFKSFFVPIDASVTSKQNN